MVSTITAVATYDGIAAKGQRNLVRTTSRSGRKYMQTVDHGSGDEDSYGRDEDEDGTASISGTEGTDFGSLTSVE